MSIKGSWDRTTSKKQFDDCPWWQNIEKAKNRAAAERLAVKLRAAK
jgi:hypothetical protein